MVGGLSDDSNEVGGIEIDRSGDAIVSGLLVWEKWVVLERLGIVEGKVTVANALHLSSEAGVSSKLYLNFGLAFPKLTSPEYHKRTKSSHYYF